MAISSNNLNMREQMSSAGDRLDSKEQIAGKGLNQPFNATNSGARKVLYGTQSDHIVPLKKPTTPNVGTGYENRYGDRSSSLIEADCDKDVIAIVPKFSFAPKYNYIVIMRDKGTHKYSMHQRTECDHSTQTYGYSYDNTYIDNVREGDVIKKGDFIRKSTSYNENNDRLDGVEMLCGYIATDRNMEDSLIFSEDGAVKMTIGEIKKITIIYNDNDIPLNMYDAELFKDSDDDEVFVLNPNTDTLSASSYGDGSTYKSFPDIGEEIIGGLVCAIRRENREEALFTQSYNRLKTIMMSDDKVTTEGRIVDITIRCNNPSILENTYNRQLKKYNDEFIRMSKQIVNIVNDIKVKDPEYKLDYSLDAIYTESDMYLKGAQFIKDGKVFTNSIMEIIVMKDKPLEIGDKSADRYGGKGVVSFILPNWMMPRDSHGRVLDVIVAQPTCVGRLNPGQLFEHELNHIGEELAAYIAMGVLTPREAMGLVIEFVGAVVPEEGACLEVYVNSLQEEELEYMLNSVIVNYAIPLSVRPITDTMTLDKLAAVYDKFPWIGQSKMYVPQICSNGQYRYIKARRDIIIAHKYMHRLKQYSEDKFSVTSLSATNIKNQNTRNKASKNYKAIHSSTPIAQGNMETDDLSHLGMEFVVTNLMIHSVSPQARRLCELMLTGDPFAVDIKLTDECTNRSVEIFNTYMKAKGLRLVFNKKAKNPKSLVSYSLVCTDRKLLPTELASCVNPDESFNYERYIDLMKQIMETSSLVSMPLVDVGED